MATKLCEGFLKSGPEEDDRKPYHKMVYTQDNKLWVLNQTGVKLPKHSWFHDTTLHGGNVLCFDLASNQWGKPVPYGPIDTDENLEDFIFSKGSDLYLCVYSRYETSEMKKLLKWDRTTGAWSEIKLEIDPSSKSSCTRADWVFAVDPNHPIVYIGMGDGGTCLAKMELGSDSATVKKLMDIPRIGKLDIPGSRLVVMGVTDGGKILVISGCEMCGFRWQKDNVLQLDPESKNAKEFEIKGDKPPFSYSGPRNTGASGLGKRWLMVGGSRAMGMYGTEFVRDIWALDNGNSSNPQWNRLPVDLPSEINGEYHFSAMDGDGRLFIADAEAGVFQIIF